MARLSRFAVAAGTSTAIILLLTLGVSTLGLWPGGHVFVCGIILKSSIILPIILGFVAAAWPSRSLNHSRLAAWTVGAGTGLVYAYVAPRVFWAVVLVGAPWHWQSLGHIDWEKDPEAAVCAVVAGTCAMLLSVTRRTRPVITTVVVITLAGMVVPAPVFKLITHDQELTVAVVTPGGPGPSDDLGVGDDTSSITTSVMNLLKSKGIFGQYHVSNLCETGHGDKALAVIVFNQPVVSGAQLPEPRGGEVIYLQLTDDRWQKIPPEVPTLTRSITVEPSSTEDELAGLTVYEAAGWSTGFAVPKTSQLPAQGANPPKGR
jgi:hypothetical protein